MKNQEISISPGERLLKVSDIQKTLNISRSLAYKIVQSGAIPIVKINSSIRIRKQDLDDYIRKSWTGFPEPSSHQVN